jgi:acylglycerol lipase
MSTAEMEQLTSGASNRIIPVLKALRTSLIFVYTLLLSLTLFLLPRRRRRLSPSMDEPPQTSKWSKRRREEEDTVRRRALAESLDMGFETGDGDCPCRWSTFLFFGARGNALFCRSWVPVSAEWK